MFNKMTEAQRSMLRTAATRDDLLLTPPANARTAAVKSLAGKLLDVGWTKEVKARSGAPVWRKDMASGAGYALKLTAKGLKAVTAAIEEADGEGAEATEAAAPARGKRAAVVAKEVAPPTELNAGQHAPNQT